MSDSMLNVIGTSALLDTSLMIFPVTNTSAQGPISCKDVTNKYHRVIRFLNEKPNPSNFSFAGSYLIVNGMNPHAWQRLTKGRNCSMGGILLLTFGSNAVRKYYLYKVYIVMCMDFSLLAIDISANICSQVSNPFPFYC